MSATGDAAAVAHPLTSSGIVEAIGPGLIVALGPGVVAGHHLLQLCTTVASLQIAGRYAAPFAIPPQAFCEIAAQPGGVGPGVQPAPLTPIVYGDDPLIFMHVEAVGDGVLCAPQPAGTESVWAGHVPLKLGEPAQAVAVT